MKPLNKTCALLNVALTTLPVAAALADVGVLPTAPAAPPAKAASTVFHRSIHRHANRAAKPASGKVIAAKPGTSVAVKASAVASAQSAATQSRAASNAASRLRPVRLAMRLPSMTPTAIRPNVPVAAPLAEAPLPTLPAADPVRLAQVPPPMPSMGGGIASTSASTTAHKTLRVGESQIYEFAGITTTAVGDPAVADIVPISKNQLLINGKGIGETTVFVYDNHGKNVIHVTVLPGAGIAPVATQIQQDINDPAITVRAVNNEIFLEGHVDSQSQSMRAEEIAKAYTDRVKNLITVGNQTAAPTEAETYASLLNENLGGSGITAKVLDANTIVLTGRYARPIAAAAPLPVGVHPGTDAIDMASNYQVQDPEANDPLTRLLKSLPGDLKVINLINFQQQEARQVLVRAKIVDINRGALKNLGLTWGTVNSQGDGKGNTTFTFNTQPFLFGQSNAPTSGNILDGGTLKRVLPLGFQLDALVNENKARILSQPSLTVLDGNPADILVGGEFPIPVVQSGSGGSGNAITVEYKPFGIQLHVQPTIVSDDTVQMTVTPEVSDLDFGRAVTFNGSVIPSLIVRKETDTLRVKDGDTLVIGGLYNNNDSRNVQKIPFLGDIPILGEFFRHTVTNKSESELVILLETEIVKPDTKGVVPPPPGSLENMGIRKPFVERHFADGDFETVQKYIRPTDDEKERPTQPVNLPATNTGDAGK